MMSDCRRHSTAGMTMLAGLSRRLRDTTRVVEDATSRDAPARLRGCCWTWRPATAGRPPGIRIGSKHTQRELAAMVGAARR